MQVPRIIVAVLLFFVLSAMVFANAVDDLQPGCWYEAPNTHLSAVDPCPQRNCSYSGSTGQGSVIGAWSGGAFDTKRNRLIVWGGGHGNYGGNELYVFDVNTLQWTRLTEPSTNIATSDPYPDGMPNSRHTYGGLVYIPPPIDRFWASGGSIWQNGYGNGHTWMYNFDASPASAGWTHTTQSGEGGGGLAAVTGYDSVSGKVYLLGDFNYTFKLRTFNPVNLASPWAVVTSNDAWITMYQTAAIDPVHRKFFVLGGEGYGTGQTQWYDLSNNGLRSTLLTTGDKAIEGTDAPGFEFVPGLNKLVAWAGGQNGTRRQDVYILDPVSLVWTCVAPASSNTVIPDERAAQGTYGRFRYIPSKRAFVVVNSSTQNVFFYKLPAAYMGTSFTRKTAQTIGIEGTPNPFHNQVKITLSHPGSAVLSVAVYDLAGRKIAHLAEKRNSAGYETLTWDARHMSAGIYIVRATADGASISEKLLFKN